MLLEGLFRSGGRLTTIGSTMACEDGQMSSRIPTLSMTPQTDDTDGGSYPPPYRRCVLPSTIQTVGPTLHHTDGVYYPPPYRRCVLPSTIQTVCTTLHHTDGWCLRLKDILHNPNLPSRGVSAKRGPPQVMVGGLLVLVGQPDSITTQ